MQTERAEPQGVAQIENILNNKDEVLAWTIFSCSSFVRRSQSWETDAAH